MGRSKCFGKQMGCTVGYYTLRHWNDNQMSRFKTGIRVRDAQALCTGKRPRTSGMSNKTYLSLMNKKTEVRGRKVGV